MAKEQKKYEFTGETKIYSGIKFHRIKALVAIAAIGVAAGDLGGWIEAEKCLSHDGNAWVSGNALVYGNAWVYGDAQVSGNAQVSGDARVSGNAWVYGNALVYGNARVSGDAQVSGNAQVSGDARVSGNARVSSDARVSRTPKVMTGFPYTLTITDNLVIAGCEAHPPSVWVRRGASIIKADGHPSSEAKAWAKIINQIAEAHGCVDVDKGKEQAQ